VSERGNEEEMQREINEFEKWMNLNQKPRKEKKEELTVILSFCFLLLSSLL